MMKRRVHLFASMLADSAPWYLPLLAISSLSWVAAPLLVKKLEAKPMMFTTYLLLPPLLVFGLLLSRGYAIFSLDMHHNEVALHFTATSSRLDQLHLFLTGYGAIEGALFALMMFSIFSPRLPSLQGVHDNTLQFVQLRMLSHCGVWVTIIMMLLLPAEAHSTLSILPLEPTQALDSWLKFPLFVIFTLLLMMAGEVLISSAHLSFNNDTTRLLQRATWKTFGFGVLAWAYLATCNAFSLHWFARPHETALQHAALLIAVYAMLLTFYHATSTRTETRFHSHAHHSKTLAYSLGVSALLLMLMTWKLATQVEAFGGGFASLISAWKVVALVMLVGGLPMLLPQLGFDSAHRPEQWWSRVGLIGVCTLGCSVYPLFWLAVPGVFFAASVHLLLPLFIEDKVLKSTYKISGICVVLLLFCIGMLQSRPEAILILGVFSLLLSHLFLQSLIFLWDGQNIAKHA